MLLSKSWIERKSACADALLAARELRLGVREWSRVLEAVGGRAGIETVRFTPSDLRLILVGRGRQQQSNCCAQQYDILVSRFVIRMLLILCKHVNAVKTA